TRLISFCRRHNSRFAFASSAVRSSTLCSSSAWALRNASSARLRAGEGADENSNQPKKEQPHISMHGAKRLSGLGNLSRERFNNRDSQDSGQQPGAQSAVPCADHHGGDKQRENARLDYGTQQPSQQRRSRDAP